MLETEINLPYITADAGGPKHLQLRLTRSRFEQMTAGLLERCRKPFETALVDAGLKAGDIDEVVLVGGSTRMPMVQELVRKLTGKDPNKSVNPDEVVAIGAAIQAGVLAGEVKDVLLLDVTPLSLGLETLGGVMTPLIERNTTIPVRKSQVFSTAEDNQTAVDIHVLQGERPMAADNMSLGRFRLDGIPPASRGIPQVEVVFDIDANGILNVSATDKASGREQSVTITASTNLNKQEIERLVKEAEQHKAEDIRRKENAEALNLADTVIYQAEKLLKEQDSQVTLEQRSTIQSRIDDLRQARESQDTGRIRQLTDDLQQLLSQVAQPAAAPAPGNAHKPEEPGRRSRSAGSGRRRARGRRRAGCACRARRCG